MSIYPIWNFTSCSLPLVLPAGCEQPVSLSIALSLGFAVRFLKSYLSSGLSQPLSLSLSSWADTWDLCCPPASSHAPCCQQGPCLDAAPSCGHCHFRSMVGKVQRATERSKCLCWESLKELDLLNLEMNRVHVEQEWGEMVTQVFWWIEVCYVAGNGHLSLIAFESKKREMTHNCQHRWCRLYAGKNIQVK